MTVQTWPDELRSAKLIGAGIYDNRDIAIKDICSSIENHVSNEGNMIEENAKLISWKAEEELKKGNPATSKFVLPSGVEFILMKAASKQETKK